MSKDFKMYFFHILEAIETIRIAEDREQKTERTKN